MLKQVSRPKHQRQRQREQRGAVMILFSLTIVVLIGFAGLAIDLGRAFVIKTELQNAMDACALSAASIDTNLRSAKVCKRCDSRPLRSAITQTCCCECLAELNAASACCTSA